MPDSEDDQHFTRTYHEYVHDDQGDVLLMCPSWDHDHERPAKTAFRVQTRHLVAHSDVFKDILDNVKTDKVTWDGLQYVDINEDEEAMAIVLAIACNMPVSSRAVNKMQWTTALATWEIANKYEMYAVRCAIGTKLLTLLATQHNLSKVLKLYTQSLKFQDTEISQAALQRAAQNDVQCKCPGVSARCVCVREVRQMPLDERCDLMRTKINGQTDLLMDTDEKLQVYFQAQQAGAAVPSAAFEEIKELLSVQSRGHAAIRRLTHMFLYEYYHEVHKTAVQDIEAKSGQRQSSRFSPCRELIRDEAWS